MTQATWRFPIGAAIAAIAFLVGGVAALLAYAWLSGMGHASPTDPITFIALAGLASIAGASYMFVAIGRKCGSDTAPRFGVLRAIGVIAYLLAFACGAFVAATLYLISL